MIVRRIARPMLSSIFITGGIDAIRNPGPKVQNAEPIIDLITEVAEPVAQKVAVGASNAADAAVDKLDGTIAESRLDEGAAGPDAVSSAAHQAAEVVHRAKADPLPFENETYIRVNGAVQVGAGVLLAIGKAPRLASAALAATLVPTTLAGHRFWEAEGDERKAQQLQFAKNMSLVGGLILAAIDTEGRPGVAWRAKHARDEGRLVAGAAGANAALAAHAVKLDAKAAKRLAKANAKLAGHAGKLGVEVAGDHAATGWKAARRQARAIAKDAAIVGHQVADLAAELSHAAADRASDAAPKVQAFTDQAVPQLQDVAERVGPRVQALADQAAPKVRGAADQMAPRVQAVADRVAPRAHAAADHVQSATDRFVDRVPSLPVFGS